MKVCICGHGGQQTFWIYCVFEWYRDALRIVSACCKITCPKIDGWVLKEAGCLIFVYETFRNVACHHDMQHMHVVDAFLERHRVETG